eukprot:gene5134-8010_t
MVGDALGGAEGGFGMKHGTEVSATSTHAPFGTPLPPHPPSGAQAPIGDESTQSAGLLDRSK